MGKPAGLHAGRKLRVHRRENKWADKQYKKRALGTIHKSSPFGGASHAKRHRPGEDRRRGQAAQLGNPKVCPRSTHQERKEDHRVRPERRLPQVRRRERRSSRRRPRPPVTGPVSGSRRRRKSRARKFSKRELPVAAVDVSRFAGTR
ncbi:MAG: hypothetical protein BJ554DRAFT_5023 [Olpidium bornovanus]|uniref:Uncharacterized protein n=1 Tax=Olpidium bornovanus TaxID=278681 RepID=A0A8H7ZZV2_9FUNG|nr:MAG: hypothetical protein BJ554DRAFT_5023 [Olpidium bornovanus]